MSQLHFCYSGLALLAAGLLIGWLIGLATAWGRSTAPTDLDQQPPETQPSPAAPPKSPVRNDAIALLAALQREARFVDFIQESLGDYSDAQVGAAVRDVHRDCGAVLSRMFALQPAAEGSEGAEIDVPDGFDPGRWHLTGNLSGQPPFRGRLVHPGWEATRCELPTWSGSREAARIVAPTEVEVP
ncbi:MAG: DUF2760 domain-containing protein [Planctomycetaceae bacterium]|nr:DUF2760 domain-containing protein [Planctomycetaceae bacterium]